MVSSEWKRIKRAPPVEVKTGGGCKKLKALFFKSLQTAVRNNLVTLKRLKGRAGSS